MSGQSPVTMKFILPTIPTEVVSKSNDINTIKRYIVTSSEEYVGISLPYMDITTIDLQRLLDSDEELQKFESILNSWGAFQLVNHGIEKSIIDQVLQLAKDFFKLPIEEKQKYAREYDVEGWKFNKMEGWGTDKVTEDQAFGWNDRLMLAIYPLKFQNPKLWPDESLPKFREVVEAYAAGLARVNETLLKAVAKMLKLPEDNLISKYANEGVMIGRMNYYPPCPYPDRIFGIRPHTDSQLFTILLQDQDSYDGLHFQKDNQWYILPTIPDAFVVNTSDMLEILTNGRVKSPTHRATTNSEQERITVVFATGPPPSSEIGPLKELIDEQRPQIYPYIKNYADTSSDFIAQNKIFIKEVRKLGPSILDQ